MKPNPSGDKESWFQIRTVTMTVSSLFKEDAYTVKYWLYILDLRVPCILHFLFVVPAKAPQFLPNLVNAKDQSLYEICASI